MFLLLLLTRSGPRGQALLASWLLAVTLLNIPWRIARPVLMPLFSMSILYFILTATLADGSPPALESRIPLENLDGLPSLIEDKAYSYVIFK